MNGMLRELKREKMREMEKLERVREMELQRMKQEAHDRDRIES
jgi:hypothetical protein